MRRRTTTLVAVGALVLGVTSAIPAAQADQAKGEAAVSVWTADVTRAQVPLLLQAGVDGHELSERVPAKGTASVELHLTDTQAKALGAKGVRLKERQIGTAALNRVEDAGDGVFRPYGGPGGLKEEIQEIGRTHRSLTKVVSIGRSLNGQDILAVKVTRDARRARDGSRPAVLYMSNQHAREWITPEMTRRLLHYYLDEYGTNREITRIVDTTELWFVLTANPDGYDFTHASPENRLWRKNLRDNNGDGKLTEGDGVDLNRNFGYRWGYDNEGSSPEPTSETYRGPQPMSEPETKVLDAFQKRIGFAYGINYHSAAQLLLYGVGWQVASSTPDDVVYRALAGTPENPAVPGYRSQLSSELYVTNGEADGHAANVNGMSLFTPEMSTCTTASRVDPDDEWRPEDCLSSFIFPDDEKLIQQEFAKNIPFALAVAKSAPHPDQPVSPVGIDSPDFVADTFGTSYADGADQTVAVTARKGVRNKRLNYRIDGGRTHTAPVRAWRGGERFGGEDNLYYDEYRGEVRRAPVGSEVTVWFTGTGDDGRVSSTPFTYTVVDRPRADTLVIAEEGGDAPAQHVGTYVQALRDSGRRTAVWDVAEQGAPHALGTLEHFSSVVWYTGGGTPGGETTLAVRAYLNEGGKLVQAGEKAGGTWKIGPAVTDDFSQYYLGADTRASLRDTSAFAALGALDGADVDLTGAEGNPLDAAGAYTVTSDSLPADEFPQFASSAGGDYPGVRTPFEPYAGEYFAAVRHSNSAWNRLSRTVDLTSVSADAKPSLDFQLSYDVEAGYDHVVVEARTPGQDDWTTLPDANGATSTDVPAECEEGFYANEHPFLRHYLTVKEDGCVAEGTSGRWNQFTGSSDGWRAVSVDLSAYAGRDVEVSVSYVSDPSTGGWGVFADEARLVGQDESAEGFETDLGAWTVAAPPADSKGNLLDWTRSTAVAHSSAAVTTGDTVLLGFGLEHVSTAAQRAKLVDTALDQLSRRH